MRTLSLGESVYQLRKQRLIYHQLTPRERLYMTLERLNELCERNGQ